MQGKVLRDSANDCGINLKTAFLWHHQLLTLPAVMKPKSLEGIVEVDETFFARSEKGKEYLIERKPRKRGMKVKRPGRSAAGVRVIEKVFHIQNVNAYHSRLKNWMDHFHDVATKYLDHYLGWFRYLDTSENPNKNELLQFQQ